VLSGGSNFRYGAFIVKIIIFIISLFAALTDARACQCSYGLLDAETIRTAKHIFNFRIVMAEISPHDSDIPYRSLVVGTIEILDVIRGDPKFKKIGYSINPVCCGSRFDVGANYLAIVSSDGDEFFASGENVLQLDIFYNSDQIREKLELLNNGNSINDVFSREVRDRTRQEPMPRPPCLPCPSCGSNGAND
jgi:hypothetical protein